MNTNIMYEALGKARDMFKLYAELHRAKGTVDSDAKAKVNEDMVAIINEALSVQSAGVSIEDILAEFDKRAAPAPGPVTPSINIEAEIAAGTLMIKTLPYVLDFALIGSAMYLRDVNDVDFAVLIDPSRNAVNYAMGMHSEGWGQCGDYDGVGGIWVAVRRENLNLMVSHDPKFFTDYKTAMEVCKALKLKHKEDRIAVCQIVRDGKKTEDVFTHDGIYGTAQEHAV